MSGGAGSSADSYEWLRLCMVAQQLRARGIRDERVLRAMGEVSRHLFVAEEQRAHAYEDRPLPIGEGQTISQPYMVAAMTEALRLSAGARVLEVGTGSGYQTAILCRLAAEVVSVERRPALARQAEEALARFGCTNVRVVVGDGTMGYAPRAPYDGIVVTAAAPAVPDALRDQLADRGRLVIPVGSSYQQELVIVERDGDRFREERGEGCVFVPLIGKQGWQG